MLTLDEWKMGRDKKFPNEWSFEIEQNAQDLIRRVNNLFLALKRDVPQVTSGWRPSSINTTVGGSKKSLHLIGKAVDLIDAGQPGEVEKAILSKTEFLLDFGLWMEDPAATPGWIHLDTGLRSARLVRIFKP